MTPATRTAPGLSDTLAAYVTGLSFEQLPAAAIAAARRALLDGVGVMLAASGQSAEVAPFVELARSSGGNGQASVLGSRLRASAAVAALANGAMAHALDYEDSFDAAPVHPNASLLPALLALAQTATAPVDGREFLTALAAGCDISCRLSLCLERPMEDGGWYPPPIIAAFGAAAGAARLLRLDALQLRDAWSLMLCQATCAGEIKYSPETVIRAVREAFPAQAAVQSVLLARSGTRGFEQPFEGRAGFFRLYVDGQYSPTLLLQELGQRQHIAELSFKPWPCCRGTHAYIEAVQQLRHQHGLQPQDVVEVRLFGGELHRMLCEPPERKRRPQTAIDARFSIPFTVAVTLLRGTVTLGDFGAAVRAETAVLALAERCRFELREGWGRERAAAGELQVLTRDGRVLSQAVPQALGHPTHPLGDEQLRAKFHDCAARARQPLSTADIGALAATILQLERVADAGAALRCEAPG